MKHPTFAALIRWRSRVDPTWEIDTTHRGFLTAEQAALFANGVGQGALEALCLRNAQLTGQLANGLSVRIKAHEVLVWHMPSDPEDLPEDSFFERVKRSFGDLSREGLDGEFHATKFRILKESAGAEDVKVRLDVDLKRNVLRVTVEGTELRTERDENDTLFGRVPTA